MIDRFVRAWEAFRQPLSAAAERGTTSGEVGSGWNVSGGIPDIDYLETLGWPAYLDEFRKVANDPQVAKELRSATYPLLRGEWCLEPASDNARDELIAEFVGANLYQQPSDNFGQDFWMQIPWPVRLRDVLRMLPYGFALFHRTYRQNGRFILIDKMKYLRPESVLHWNFEKNDQWLGVTRTYIGTDGSSVSQEFVPAEELVIYTWDQEGSNILGRPLIRPMWKPYNFKTIFEKLSVINKQKTSVGVPYFQTSEGDSPEDEARGEQVAKAMRGGNFERLWVKLKKGQDFGWKEGGDSTKGFPELITGQNTEIAKAGGAGLVQELGLGQEGGSRGVAGAQALAGVALPKAISIFVILMENQIIASQVDLNFPGRVQPPTLKVSGIDPFEKTRNLPEIVTAVQGGVITNTLDTENEIRRGYDMMEITEEERTAAIDEAKQAAPPAAGDSGAPGGPGTSKTAPPGTDPGDAGATGDKTDQLLSRLRFPVVATRADAGEEPDPIIRARVDAEKIRGELERWEGAYLGTLSMVQKDMREAIVAQVAGGKRPRTPADVKVPFQDDLKDRLISILKSVRDFGRDQVVAEVNRQLLALRRSRAVADPSTRRGAIAYSNNQAEVTANLDVSGLVQRLQAETVAQYNDLAGTGAAAEVIAAGLDSYLGSLSTRQIESMARSSTATVFNAGRNVSILELKSQLQPEAVRVEVLDKNTCDPCATPAADGGLDGYRARIGTTDYLEHQPPRGCEGGENCRGFYIVEAKP